MTSNTLLIKHFPSTFTSSDIETFLANYGGTVLKCLRSSINKYNTTFARFANEEVARQVLNVLHQMKVHDSYLSVEFARESKHTILSTSLPKLSGKFQTEDQTIYERFLSKLNSWTVETDFRMPIPIHLKYQYPPPSVDVLQQICNTLACTPRFYIQVLHLMNKMNLPCPFDQENVVEVDEGDMELESEISSNPESELSDTEPIPKEIIPLKKAKRKKQVKRPKFVKPTIVPQVVNKRKKTLYEEVFESAKEEKKVERKIPKLSFIDEKDNETLIIESDKDGGFGFIIPINKTCSEAEKNESDISEECPQEYKRDEREEWVVKKKIDCISKETLDANRISEKDRSVLPIFKNYAEGAPTCRLYLKNLAKQTTEDDLRFIYNRFIDQSPDSEKYDVRLMQEGRMKGQAFITLQTAAKAKEALLETNGYILNNKPMVVQFARSNN